MHVVVCGGGAIGTSIAYFLARRGADVTLIERSAIACAASGKSGGFLALDWCDGGPLEALARRSFALHSGIAEELGGADWGYRRMTTYGGHASYGSAGASHAGPVGWVSMNVAIGRPLGSTETTAQVHPGLYTSAMMRAAEAAGARLRIGEVTGIARPRERVTGVTVDAETVATDAVVIAMGPWSVLATQWLPIPPIFGLKGHSLVFDTGNALPADALFLDFAEASGEHASPEVFPRSDGTTYVCAISSEEPLPLDPADVAPEPRAIERLEAICRAISPTLAGAEILRRQACFRPVSRDGVPLIGPVPGVEGAYVATGHSVWGILNAPATGEAMAELILDGAATTVDLETFAPGRMRPFDPARLKMNR